MSGKQPSDWHVRQQAIAVDRSFLVEAPAGSGKTELLTDRILALLARVQRPEDIVAITFTRKAAAEMHQRVMDKLALAQGPVPEQPYLKQSWHLAKIALERANEKGWDLLNYPARLSIRTIDSLCAHLVQAMPWSSRLGGVPGIAESPQQYYLEAARQTLLNAGDYPQVAAVLQHLNMSFERAEKLIVEKLARREQWLPILSKIDDFSQIEINLEQLIQRHLKQLIKKMPLGWAQTLAPLVRFACDTLKQEGRPCPFDILQDWDGRPFGEHISDVPYWQAIAQFLLTSSGTLRRPRGVNISLGFPREAKEKEALAQWLDEQQDGASAWVAELQRAKAFPTGYLDEQKEVLDNLVVLLRLAAAHLRLVFAEHQEVDFIEITQQALFALGHSDDPTELLLRLDRNVQHLLVDEFQDTSLLQLQVLERIISGWQPDDGRTVFLVGDPMQSIYRFRMAEVGLFLEVKQQKQLGPVPLTVLQLKENFRSHPSLVEWVNQSGPELLAKENNSEFGKVAFSPAQAFHSGQGQRVFVHPAWLFQKNTQTKAEKAKAEKRQLEQAQNYVIQVCQEVLAKHSDKTSPVGILVRNRNHLEGLVRALTQVGIPCRAVELDPLASRPAVQDLMQLIRALTHPGDRMAWLALLRSPLCGLTLESLYHLCLNADSQTPILKQLLQIEELKNILDKQEYKRLLRLANVVLGNQNMNGALTLASWVAFCWQALGGPGIYHKDVERADVEQVFLLLEKLAPYGQVDLDELQQKLEALYAAADDVAPAVEVMTIHKSKGLEFESVILYGLHKQPKSDTLPLLSYEISPTGLVVGPIVVGGRRKENAASAVANYLFEREKIRNEQEIRRLLYVALTRARSSLHLVANLQYHVDKAQRRSPSKGTLLAVLWPLIENSVSEPTQAESEQQKNQSNRLSLELEQSGNRLWRIADTAWCESQLNADRKQQLENRLDVGAQWHWESASHNESAVGQVAHAWLEHIARDGLHKWPIKRVQSLVLPIERQLRRAGCSRNYVPTAVKEVMQALIKTLESEKGQWLLEVAKAQREWSLLDYQGRVSIIDLAIDQQDHWLVVDYKTSVPRPDEPMEHFILRMRMHHEEQLARYCAQVTALDGRPAKAALYFPRIDYWYELKLVAG